MSYRLLNLTARRARKQHRCIWCGETIPIGEKYKAERAVFEGEMQNGHWHSECWDLSRITNDDFEFEFTPYGNERGRIHESD